MGRARACIALVATRKCVAVHHWQRRIGGHSRRTAPPRGAHRGFLGATTIPSRQRAPKRVQELYTARRQVHNKVVRAHAARGHPETLRQTLLGSGAGCILTGFPLRSLGVARYAASADQAHESAAVYAERRDTAGHLVPTTTVLKTGKWLTIFSIRKGRVLLFTRRAESGGWQR